MNILEGEPRKSELLSLNLCQTVQGPIGTGECVVQRPEDREGVLERPTLVWCRLISSATAMQVRKWGMWILALVTQVLASLACQICYRGDSPKMDQICNFDCSSELDSKL